MSGGNQVVLMSALLVEGSELNESVAHHVGVGCQSRANLIHRVFRHLIPVFLMAVHNLQLATIFMADGCGHLQVLLARAVPLLFFLRTNLDVETVGL